MELSEFLLKVRVEVVVGGGVVAVLTVPGLGRNVRPPVRTTAPPPAPLIHALTRQFADTVA